MNGSTLFMVAELIVEKPRCSRVKNTVGRFIEWLNVGMLLTHPRLAYFSRDNGRPSSWTGAAAPAFQ